MLKKTPLNDIINVLKKEKQNTINKEEGGFIEKKTPQQLIFEEESLFTHGFGKDVVKIIGENKGKDFRKYSMKKRKEIVERLEKLVENEVLWKDLVRNSMFDSKKITNKIFKLETMQFKEIYDTSFYPLDGEKKKNVIAKYPSSKAVAFFKGVLRFIYINNTHLFKEEVTLDDLQALEVTPLTKELEPDVIFSEIVRTSLKKAYDCNINIEISNRKRFYQNKLDTNFLRVKRTDIQYSFREFTAIYLTSKVLQLLGEKGYLLNKTPENMVFILQHLRKQYREKSYIWAKEDIKSWYFKADDLTMVFIDMFSTTNVVKGEETETTKNKNYVKKIYVLNHKLDEYVGETRRLPKLIPPKKAETLKCVEEWVKPIKYGTNKVSFSNNALLSLNVAQKKEFVVNNDYLRLLQEKDKEEKCKDYPTRHEYVTKVEDYYAWTSSTWVSALSHRHYVETESLFKTIFLKKKEKKKNEKVGKQGEKIKAAKRESLHQKIIQGCGITYSECHANLRKNVLKQEMLAMRNKRQLLLTSIDVAKLLKDYPLFYSTSLDFRTRMYPFEYLLSRVTGYLKHILKDSKNLRLTSKGLKNMFQAYYAPNKDLLKKFNKEFPFDGDLKYDDLDFEKLRVFFSNNKLPNPSDTPVYFSLLHNEISDLVTKKKKTTGVSLEIDQVASGPTLVAILTGNKSMSAKCNLNPGDFVCLYTYLLGETGTYIKAFLGEYKVEGAVLAFKYLTCNRKAQKFAFMCYMYNELHKRRTEKWKEHFEEVMGLSLNEEGYQLISQFSINYDKFIEHIFPKLTKQLSRLDQGVKLFTNTGKGVKIRTLDDCLIEWDFSDIKKYKKNYYNSVTKKHSQYRLNVPSLEKNTAYRQQKHRRSFRPNFIHSIDAALMRMMILQYFKATGLRLNHLHDCVMVHPNNVDILYDIIRDIYCDKKLKNMISDLMFKPFYSDTSGGVQDALSKIEKNFLDDMDDLNLTKESFDPRKCYRYEGSE